MLRPLALFIGLRYTGAKRRNHFISFISLISMLGIALGITALITVISVMNGFEKELRDRTLEMLSDATVYSLADDFHNWSEVLQRAAKNEEVLGVAPFIDRETLMRGFRARGALVRGIDPNFEHTVSDIGKHMLSGSIDDLHAGSFGIVLGRDLARGLGVSMGEKVTVFAPQLRTTPAGVLPLAKGFTVVGLFSAGMQQFDAGLALIHLHDAQRLFRTGGGIGGLHVKVRDKFRARAVSQALVQDLGGVYRVKDWSEQNVNLFHAVAQEKLVMFVILSLIVAVAAFNIVSTLVMVVTDKAADIAILRTLGAAPRTIMAVFLVQGMLIGLVGSVLGTLGGVALAANIETLVPMLEHLLGIHFLAPDVYYISELPSDLRFADVIWITSISFFMSLMAGIYPSWRASRTQPAEALRYE